MVVGISYEGSFCVFDNFLKDIRHQLLRLDDDRQKKFKVDLQQMPHSTINPDRPVITQGADIPQHLVLPTSIEYCNEISLPYEVVLQLSVVLRNRGKKYPIKKRELV